MDSISIQLPPKVQSLLETLRLGGYEAYIVGGCVRDAILSRTPNDWDITTSAKPEEVKALFRRTVDTGIKHGTVTVLMGNDAYEVTTYRIDGDYEDGRHPKEVTFTASLSEDLRRRDFTINAMAYSDAEGLVDLFGGIQDLQDGIIRAVGDPKERFSEDALRIMRAVRFAAQLGYKIEEKTGAAIGELAPTLSKVSAERIHTELTKLILSDHPEFLMTAYALGITAVVLPEFDACMGIPVGIPVGEHIVRTLMAVRSDPVLRYTMLFHDFAKPATLTVLPDGRNHFPEHAAAGEKVALDIMRRLKFDNNTIKAVATLVREHSGQISEDEISVRRAVSRLGGELFLLLTEVIAADGAGKSPARQQEKEQHGAALREIYERVTARGDCTDLKHLAVNGGDLMKAGVKPGRDVGRVLGEMLEAVLADPTANDRNYLLNTALPEILAKG